MGIKNIYMEILNISPQILKQLKKDSSCLAKQTLADIRKQLDGQIPISKMVMARRMVNTSNELEIEEVKRAFCILQRYFKMKYGNVQYSESYDKLEHKVVFTISFKTKENYFRPILK